MWSPVFAVVSCSLNDCYLNFFSSLSFPTPDNALKRRKWCDSTDGSGRCVSYCGIKRLLRSLSTWAFHFLSFYVLNGNFRQRKHIDGAAASLAWRRQKVKSRKSLRSATRERTVEFIGIIVRHSLQTDPLSLPASGSPASSWWMKKKKKKWMRRLALPFATEDADRKLNLCEQERHAEN